MIAKSERLTVLSDAEQEALYDLPDFDDAQRLYYLTLTETELALANSRSSIHAQIYCILQIGYFKAKHTFFRFDWNEVEDDCAFVSTKLISPFFTGSDYALNHVSPTLKLN
jgi:hypothetical protein